MFGTQHRSTGGRSPRKRTRPAQGGASALKASANIRKPGIEALEARRLLTTDLTADITQLLSSGQTTGSHTFQDVAVGQFLKAGAVTIGFAPGVQDGPSGWSGTVTVSADTATMAVGGTTSGLTLAIAGDGQGGAGLTGQYQLGGQDGGSGAFSLAAAEVTADVPDAFHATASAVAIGYDPAGPAVQQVATVGSLSATIIPFHDLTATLAGLVIDTDGFSLASGSTSVPSLSLGGVLTATTPALTVTGLSNLGGAVAGTFGLSAGSVQVLPGNAAFTATVDGFRGTFDLASHATTISAGDVSVAIGPILTGVATGLNIAYAPATDVFSLAAGSVDLTSGLFSGVEVHAASLAADATGLSIADATLTQASPTATIDVGGVLELGGLTLGLHGFDYQTHPAAGTAAVAGTVTVGASSIGLFGGSLPFSTSVAGFSGSYDIASKDLEVGATSATMTVGTTLTVVATGPHFAIVHDPATGGQDVSVTVASATATVNELGGLTGSITGLAINSDGFTVGSGTLSKTGNASVGTFLTVVNPSISLATFGYSKSKAGGAAFTASSLAVTASEIDLALGSASAKATGVAAAISFAPGDVGHFTFAATSLTAALGSTLTLTATGTAANPLAFDSAPAAGGYVAQFATASASLNLAGSTITGMATNFAIGAGGVFVAEDGFGTSFTLTSASQVDFPSWLPIKSASLALSWPSFSTAPGSFVIDFSAVVSGTIGGLSVAGSVQDAVIDTSLLSAGQFPVTSLGGFGVSVGGTLFGVQAQGQLFLSTLQTDASFDPITVAPGTEPAHNYLYGGIDVGVNLDGLGGFDFRLGVSQLGPLDIFVDAQVPILLDPDTGLTITDIHGGVEFNTSLPAITRAKDLLNNPALTPPGQQTLAQWETVLAGQVANQVKAVAGASPSAFDGSSLTSGGIVIDVGATLFSAYATEDAFELSGDILFDTTGKFEATGNLTLGTALTVKGGVYVDLSKIKSGAGAILAYAQVPDPSGSATPLAAIYGGITFTFGTSAPTGLAGDAILNGTSDYATAAPIVPTNAAFTAELWAKRTDAGLSATEDVINQGGGQDLEVGFDASGEFFATLGGTTLTDTTASDEGWHHWAVSFGGGTLSIDLDGSAVATVAATAAAVAGPALLIGKSTAPTPTFFEGSIAEVRIWNVARTDAQIAADMGASGVPGYGGVPLAAGATIEPGLIADWSFAATTGTAVVVDSSGANHDATLVGTRTYGPLLTKSAQGVASPIGDSLTLNGTTDYASAAPVVPVGTSFTVEFWARRGDSGRLESVLGQGGLQVGFDATNRFFATTGGATLTYASTDQSWHHWAVSFDAATDLWSINLDGSTVAHETAAAFVGTANVLSIGRSGSTYFQGSITDVRAWGLARTASQVAADMNGDGVPGYGGTPLAAGATIEPGLLGSWSFAEAGATVGDTSGHDHTASVFGSLMYGPTIIHPAASPQFAHQVLTITFNGEADLTLPRVPGMVVIAGTASLTADVTDGAIDFSVDGTAGIDPVGNALGLAGYVHVDLGRSPDAYGAFVVDTAQLSTLKNLGIDVAGDALLEFNTTSSAHSVTLNIPDLSSTLIPPPTIPTSLTVAASSAQLVIQGSADFSKGGKDWFQASGTLIAAFNDTAGPELDLYIDGTINVGPASSPLLTLTALGLVDISDAGLATSFTATLSGSAGLGRSGVTLNGGTFHFVLNTTDRTIAYMPPAIPGVSGSAAGPTVSIPAAPPGQATGQPYLEIDITDGEVDVEAFALTGSFSLIVSPAELSIAIGATLAVKEHSSTLLSFGATGGLLLDNEGTQASPDWRLAVGANLTFGSSSSLGSGLAINANFLFEVNTFSTAETIAGLTIQAGAPIFAEVHASGDLTLGSFDVAGTFDFTLAGGSVTIAALGTIGLGQLGTASVDGTLGYDATDSGFYGLLQASVSNASSTDFSLSANFEFSINTTAATEQATGFTINATNGAVTPGQSIAIAPDSFAIEAGGTLTVAGVIAISGEFDLTRSGTAILFHIAAAFQNFFGTSLTVTASAEIFGADGQGSGGLVVDATLTGTFAPAFGGGLITLAASPELLINTSDATRLGVAPNTEEVALRNVSLDFFGLRAGGTIIAGITNGHFELDIPQSSPLTVGFFGLGTMSFYGSIDSDGQFDLTGSVGVYLSQSGVGDVYGGITVTVSNSGFSGSFYGGADVDVLGKKYNIGSLSGSLVIASGYFRVQANLTVVGVKVHFNIQVGQASPPALTPGIDYFSAPPTADEGQEVDLDAMAADSGGNAINASTGYSWSVSRDGQDFAAGDASNTSGMYSFSVGAPGIYVVTLSAGGYSRTATIRVLAVAPTIASTGVPATYAYGTTGTASYFQPTAYAAYFDPTSNPLSYSWSVVEDGAGTPATSHLSYLAFNPGVPNPVLGSDVYTITLTVSDAFGGTTTATSTVTVYDPTNLLVSNTDDSGPGSLRQALQTIAAAGYTSVNNDNYNISIAPGLAGQTLLLTSNWATDTTNPGLTNATALAVIAPVGVTIDGSKAPGFTISAAGQHLRLFTVARFASLQLHDLNLTGGDASNSAYGGGAAYADGYLQLYNCSVYGNQDIKAPGGTNTNGLAGGVYVDGTLLATQTTFSGNTSTEQNASDPTRQAGAIYVAPFGDFTLINDTIANNTATAGTATSTRDSGGLEEASYDERFAGKIVNSILYGNHGSHDVEFDGNAPTLTAGANVIGTSVGVPASAIASTADPRLGPLADHGGGLMTYSLLPGSSAVDLGRTSNLLSYSFDSSSHGANATLDGRGFAQVDPYHAAGVIDAGAFETQPYLVSTIADSGPGSLRAAVTGDDNGATILLGPSLAGQTIALNSSLEIKSSLTLAWTNPGQLIIQSAASSLAQSLLIVDAGAVATISGVTITGGSAALGGGISNLGTLTLNDDVFSHDVGSFLGGAVYNQGTLAVSGSYFVDDRVDSIDGGYFGGIAEGGAIANYSGGTATITDSTFASDQAISSSSALGGAIVNFGRLSATDVTFSAGTATGATGQANGGEFENLGTATLISCTFAGGTLAANDSSLAPVPVGGAGAASLGEAIANASGATLSLINSIVTGGSSTAGTAANLVNAGTLTGSHDVITGLANGLGALTGVIVADPMLSSLASNGGPTPPTLAILAGSSAAGAGDPSQLGGATVDGRGYARTVGGQVDIGAYERQVYVVTSPDDTGPGTLRQAVADDTTGDEPIGFAAALDGQTLDIGSAITISHTLTIAGPGANLLAINADYDSQIFVITGGNVAISGLTLEDAESLQRGGAIDNAGRLTLTGLDITATEAFYSGNGGVAQGGAIYDAPGSSLTVIDSTFSSNTAVSIAPQVGVDPDGGTIYAAAGPAEGGAISNDVGAILNLSNDTFTIDSATVSSANHPTSGMALGGAIYNAGIATIINATIANNSVSGVNPAGAGIYLAGGGTLTIDNSIVFDKDSGVADFESRASSRAVVGDHDLIGRSDGFLPAGLVASQADPGLGPLMANGGPTPTMLPAAGSVAIDAGNSADATLADQRGFSRTAGASVDLGAVETSAALLVTSAADSGPGSLRDAIAYLAAYPFSRSIAFAPSLAGATITVQSSLLITGTASIDGAAAPGLAISGAGNIQPFFVRGSLSLANLTIEDGAGPEGGAIINYGTLSLLDVTLTGNSTEQGGGALENDGTATITNSTITDNLAYSGYGGGIENNGTLTLLSDTIAGNTAGSGGGLYDGHGSVNLRDTIIAGNSGASDVLGPISSQGHNLFGVLSSMATAASTDLTNASPDLGPLLLNAGAAPTLALLPGSRAIASGDATNLGATDGRGLARLVGGHVDIGAYQTQDVLTVANASAVYGGTATVTATLLDDGIGLANQTISFYNGAGTLAGTALTNAAGVATLANIAEAGVAAGSGSGFMAVFAPPAGARDNAARAFSTLTITQAALTVTVADASKVYGQANPTFTATVVGLVGGDQVQISYMTAAASTSDAGSDTITPRLHFASSAVANSYAWTINAGTLTILRADPTIAWAAPAAIVYGTPLGAAQLDAAVAVPGPAAAGAITYGTPAGTVLGVGQVNALTVNVAATTDYNAATAQVPIAVTPAPLTITAADQVMVAGGNVPTLTATYAGFVDGEGPGSLASPLVLATAASALSVPGVYAIDPSGAASPNYAITEVAGSLTVVAQAVVITIAAPPGSAQTAVNSPVDSATVTFSQAIDTTTFSASDIALTRDGQPVALAGVPTIRPVSPGSKTYIVAGLAPSTVAEGFYSLTIGTAGLADTHGFAVSGSTRITWLMDVTAPTSSVQPLPAFESSYTFAVTARGSDPLSSDGMAGSGVASEILYASDNGAPFVAFATVTPSSTSAYFTGQAGHTYYFRSVAEDAAGNVEAKPVTIEASTIVPDLSPPITSIVSAPVAQATGLITLNMAGRAGGAVGLASFILSVRVDGGPSQVVATLAAGSPDAMGTYRASASYQAAEDGLKHIYDFAVVGVSQNGIVEAAHARPDAEVVGTFTPLAPQVTGFSVDHGAVGRSFVRYADVTLNESDAALAALIAGGKVRLVRHELDGTGSTTLPLPAGSASVVDHAIELDFGPNGIGSLLGATTADSTVGDGYYEVDLDLDGSGEFASHDFFYRLFGDVAGDRSVDANDINLISGAVGLPTASLTIDLDGTGSVTAANRTLARRSQLKGLALAAGLHLDA